MDQFKNILNESKLGKKLNYSVEYNPELLFTVPRKIAREHLAFASNELPFHGGDYWNAYEFSWLNARGKPQVAVVEFFFSAESLNIIESKSFKFYLNSFHQARFQNEEEVITLLKKDLTQATGGEVVIQLRRPSYFENISFSNFSGICLDDLDVTIDHKLKHQKGLFCNEGKACEEKMFTHLFKSNCPVTGQPDWASIWIHYVGKPINQEGLLNYFIQYRDDEAFAEQCVEKIFLDIVHACQPEYLTVYARFTRRGGIDINPVRSNFPIRNTVSNDRLFRQ